MIKVSYLCVALSIPESILKKQGFVCFTLFGDFGSGGGFGFGGTFRVIIQCVFCWSGCMRKGGGVGLFSESGASARYILHNALKDFGGFTSECSFGLEGV